MLRVAALSALAATVSGEGLTYLWNQNNRWSNTANWNGGNFNGLVDLSQDCVNQFNSDDKAGMALGLDMDATAGTLRLPATGKLVLGKKANGEAASLTFTGGSAPSNSWNCRPRVATSSSCSSNYKVFDGTTEITTTKPPCWEDTVVIDLDVVSSMTWHPGHVIKELKVTRGYQSPAAEGTMIAMWPAPVVENVTALQYDAWDNSVVSRIAGASPSISECPNADCQIYCFNACPAADITDLDLADGFGKEGGAVEEGINAALDSAVQARAAIGRTKNALTASLSDPGEYAFNVAYVIDELMQQEGLDIAPADLLARVETGTVWIEGIFLGWSVRQTDEGVISIARQGATSNLDYNIAWEQAKHAIRYISQLDSSVRTPDFAVPTVFGTVKATSSSAAHMLTGDTRNIPSTAVGGLESDWTRGRIAAYLTNDRAQVTARYFQNAKNDDVTATVWEAPDTYAANTSKGVLLSARARRTAANAAGENANKMIARVIEGANRLTFSAGGSVAATIRDIASLTCGSYWPEDSTDRFAQGACVATDITLLSNNLYYSIPDEDDENATKAISLVTPAIFESTLGLVITQMSMHAVGVMLNESIVRTDNAWTAFTAPSAGEEEEGLPMMIIIAAGAGCLLLTIIVVVIVVMSGGEKEEKSNRNVIAFENPMYDDPTDSGGGNFDAGEDGGLYDEPTFQADNKQNPTYSSEENVADPGAGGYLDVEPDDGDDDDDDDDEESSDDDDDDE